jgi:hypothetical protein
MLDDKAALLNKGRMDMFRQLFQTVAFALSERPTEHHRNELKTKILKSDDDRAKGIMSALSRGSVLLQLEEAHVDGTRP